MTTRIFGMALLGVSALAISRLYEISHRLPYHQATGAELLLSLVIVVTGLCGAALVVVGAALFRTYQWPPAD